MEQHIHQESWRFGAEEIGVGALFLMLGVAAVFFTGGDIGTGLPLLIMVLALGAVFAAAMPKRELRITPDAVEWRLGGTPARIDRRRIRQALPGAILDPRKYGKRIRFLPDDRTKEELFAAGTGFSRYIGARGVAVTRGVALVLDDGAQEFVPTRRPELVARLLSGYDTP